MQRYATVTVLAEDERASNLLRRYAERALGVTGRRLVPVVAPPGKGDAKKWVLERYPTEVRVYRQGLSHRGLLVHLDLDTDTAADRQLELAESLKRHGLAARSVDERIAHVLMGRHVESWLAALTGQVKTPDGNSLNEVFDCKGQRFPREPDQLVRTAVSALYDLTRTNYASPPPLPSLGAAAVELRRLE